MASLRNLLFFHCALAGLANVVCPLATPPGIGEGSLVLTGQGNYFIAISAGKLEWEGRRYYLISLASPIGVALANRKAGETISFREQSIPILEVL